MKNIRFFIWPIMGAVLLAGIFVFWQPVNIWLNSRRASLTEKLLWENEGLRREVARLRAGDDSHDYTLLTAKVYSRYPFNDDGRLQINLGEEDGLKSGWPVLLREGRLLGRVTAVRRTTAEIETVFSPNFKTTVLIRTVSGAETKGLLTGGQTPQLSLIPREISVQNDEAVINISPEFPLGLFWGRTGDLILQEDSPWIEGKLTLDYRFEDIDAVILLSDFNRENPVN